MNSGRLIFMSYLCSASHANLPLIPPFLEPSADYSYGVNFASGGAGVLPETHQGLVIIQNSNNFNLNIHNHILLNLCINIC